MKFFAEIRKRLGYSPSAMGREVDLMPLERYKSFEDSKLKLSSKPLIKLWRVSGLSGDEFLSRIEKELHETPNTRSKPKSRKLHPSN